MTDFNYSRAAPLFTLALLGMGTTARAALLTASATPPAAAAISQPDFSAAAFTGAQDFTDNAGPPGQTFTVGSVPLVLTGVTVKGFANTGASFGGNVNTAATTWTITMSAVGPGGVLNQLDQETADPSAITDGSAYVTLTFNQGTPLVLAANTQYAFDIFTSQGYFGLAKSSTDVYAGGAAIQHGSTARTSANAAAIVNAQAVDRTFYINPVAIPEPGSLGVLGVAAAGLLARRRRRA